MLPRAYHMSDARFFADPSERRVFDDLNQQAVRTVNIHLQ